MTETAAPSETSELQDEIRSWLEDNWDPDLSVADWWQRLGLAGWSAPTWPVDLYGKGLSRDDAAVVAQEIRSFGALGAPNGLGLMLAGPTIVTHGTPEQHATLLPDIVTGAKAWCQLFSEPGAGSDLAGLQAKAVKDGDEWTVNGQKVWTSGAQISDLGMLLVRSNPDVPKHKGISYFAVDMDQPGIDIRPLREMTGHALFNEVFMTDVRVADDRLIGGLDNGWAVANTTLANERASLGAGGAGAATSAQPGTKAGHLPLRAGDFVKSGGGGGGGVWQALSGGLVMSLAKQTGAAKDPVIRQDLMRLHTLNEIARYTNLRMKAAKAAGRGPGPEANTAKLNMTAIMRLNRDLGPKIAGAGGMLAGSDAPVGGGITELTLFAPAVSIYGGSDEIQKNIIGERVLGLPREPRTDKDIAFKDMPQAT